MQSAVPSEPVESWLENFQPFTPTHAAVVVGFIAITAALVMLGQRWRGSPAQSRLEIRFGIGGLIFWVVVNAWWLLPAHFDPSHSWPLHLCDLAALIAPLAILTNARPLRALLYFWGLGLNSQVFVTPLVRAGPATINFWFFWLYHAIIVGAAIYDLMVRGFRPRWRDYFLAVATGGIYLCIVLPIDILFGLNYGYVGNLKPHRPTVIDLLGPWPLRVVVIVLLVCLAMALLMLPWALARRWHDEKRPNV